MIFLQLYSSNDTPPSFFPRGHDRFSQPALNAVSLPPPITNMIYRFATRAFRSRPAQPCQVQRGCPWAEPVIYSIKVHERWQLIIATGQAAELAASCSRLFEVGMADSTAARKPRALAYRAG
jgi:hypothetical protein